MPSYYDRIQRYFRAKRRVLLASSEEAVTDHPTINGSHREEINKIFMRDILPTRYDVSSGKIIGPLHTSRQMDIIISDSANFPKLPLSTNRLAFAESALTAIEVKTCYTYSLLTDVYKKTKSVLDIVTLAGTREPLDTRLSHLENSLHALETGQRYSGMMHVRQHIGTGAIFLHGGTEFDATVLSRFAENHDLDDGWPDLTLFLEPGLVCIKDRESEQVRLCFAGDDGLLLFTANLLELLGTRAAYHPHPDFLMPYVKMILPETAEETVRMPISRPLPLKRALFGD